MRHPLLLPPGRHPMFPPASQIRPRADGLVAVGADLEPETLIEAYQKGVFPWDGDFPYPWYSPDPRCVLVPGAFRASHSLEKTARRGHLRVVADTRFREVMRACAAQPRRGQRGTWISPHLVAAYGTLHDRGVAHSVEVLDSTGALVGGLYGLSLGRAFFGESMFTRVTDASKLALWKLCRALDAAGYAFVDCQQDTPHLRSLGAVLVSRAEYLQRLEAACAAPEGWPEVAATLSRSVAPLA
jgi:leucyl/phenylalanyl-tRNA--protein transferase